MKILIINDTHKHKTGDIIDSTECLFLKEGFEYKNNFIGKKNYVLLQEELTNEDLAKINALIEKKLVKMFWRLFTRSKFILQ